MTDLRTQSTRDWRSYLTPDEKREIDKLETIIARAEKMAFMPRILRGKIQNRATVRAGNDR